METKDTNFNLETTLGRGVDRASIGAHDTLKQISNAAGPAMDRMATSAHGVIDTVTDAATSAVATLGIKSDQLNDARQKLTEAARTYMREKPVASLGIAVAAGWILSRLLR
jgi:ElaB/YqjD/DUF883 family membrane-anchored ribosome-binding protein